MKLYLLAIACLFSTAAAAQYNLTGRVVDQETKNVLTGANITTTTGTYATATDEQGHFELSGLKKGSITLVVSYVGFETQEVIVELPYSNTLIIELEASIYLTDAVLITATRASDNMPLTFSQINKEDIEVVNMGRDIPYLLESMPSVVTTSDAGTGVGYTGMRIRGSDATRINVTLNGIPYNDSESQGVYWVDLPDMASSVESIQVQRGVGTSTNGPGAFGASINVQTTGLNEKPYAEIASSFGSFNTWKNTVKVGTGLINNAFTVDGRISKITSDGYIDRATSNLTSFYLSGGYYGKNNILKLNIFSGHEITYQAWYGTPESRINNNVQGMNDYITRNWLSQTEADNLLNSGRTYNFYTYDNQVDDYQQTHYQLIYATNLTQSMTWNTALHLTHGEGYFEQYKNEQDLLADYGFVGGITDLIRRRWLSNDFYGLTFSLDYEPSTKMDLIIGGAWNKYDGDHFGEIIWAQNTGNASIRDRYYDNNGTKYDFTIYGKLSLDITSEISLFGDLQYRNADYTLFGIDNDQVPLHETHEFNFFNPKVGINYHVNDHANFYASFSIGNKEPSRSDFVDSPDGATPKAETLNNLEVGYKQSTGRFTLNANYYLMNYKNQLVLTGELNDVGTPLRTNVDKSYRTGVELLAGIELSPKFNLDFNATFSNNIIKDYTEVLYDYGQNWDKYNALITNYEQTTISFSPGIVSGGSLKYSPVKGLLVSWNHKYVGDQYMDNTANEHRKLAGYYFNDLIASYSFSALKMREIGIKVAVYNLFNNLYESNGYTFGYKGGGEEIRENLYYPQAGINFMVGVTLKL